MSVDDRCQLGGNLDALARQLDAAWPNASGRVHPHYYGVTMLNLAIVCDAQDEPRLAMEYAERRIEALEETSVPTSNSRPR